MRFRKYSWGKEKEELNIWERKEKGMVETIKELYLEIKSRKSGKNKSLKEKRILICMRRSIIQWKLARENNCSIMQETLHLGERWRLQEENN